MQSVKSLAKAVSKEMADSLKGTEELLTLALTKAQKDNNTVYLERVPPFAGGCGHNSHASQLERGRPGGWCGQWAWAPQGTTLECTTCLLVLSTACRLHQKGWLWMAIANKPCKKNKL